MSKFALKPKVVESCMWDLARRPTHRHLPGYLGMVRTANIEGSTSGLDYDYSGFYNAFFRVRNYTEYNLSAARDDENLDPYLIPFGPSDDPDRHSLWMNPNVAGTYAPSSIRPGQPFSQVVDVDGSGRSATYSLVDDHFDVALEELCQGQPLPVGPLAGFLYRDFGLEEENLDAFTDIFIEEFGYEHGGDEFETLYADTSIEWEADDAFVEVNDD